MIYNDINFCDFLMVNEIKRSILPPQEVELKDIPLINGSMFIRKKLGVGVIEVDVTIVANNRVNLRNDIRNLAGMLYTENPVKLILDDEPNKYNMAILSGDTELEEIWSIGEGTLTFLCPDPLAYGDTKNFIIPGIVNNNGTYKTKGKIIINIDIDTSYLQIRLVSTGEYIYIEHPFIIGDIVEIDFNAKWKVKKNGAYIDEDVWLESRYFFLPPGSHTIEIDPVQNAEIEFIERWL